MKRITACIFALIFWAVLICTALSVQIKDWMTPQVSTTSVGYNRETNENTLPISALFTDETGQHIYQLAEGTDENPNTTLREYSSENYTVYPDRIVMRYGDTTPFVQYATRPLKPEDTVEKLEMPIEKADDTWLIFFPEEVPVLESKYPKAVTIEDQAEGVFLAAATRVEQPFSEGRAKSYLIVTPKDAEETDDPFLDALLAQSIEYRVYSLSEIQQFFEEIPWLSVVGSLMILSLGLWISSCLLARRGDARRGDERGGAWPRKLIAANAVLAGVLFGGMVLILNRIDLPSSLLPTQTILDTGHYTEEFSGIFRALETLSRSGNSTARALLSAATGKLRLSLVFPAIGLLLSAVVILLERLLRRPRRVRKGAHRAL